MPMDEVPTEKVASQQQTLAEAESPLHDMTVTCKQATVLSREESDATSAMPGMQEMDS